MCVEKTNTESSLMQQINKFYIICKQHNASSNVRNFHALRLIQDIHRKLETLDDIFAAVVSSEIIHSQTRVKCNEAIKDYFTFKEVPDRLKHFHHSKTGLSF